MYSNKLVFHQEKAIELKFITDSPSNYVHTSNEKKIDEGERGYYGKILQEGVTGRHD